MEVFKMKVQTTITIDADLFKEFKEICEENDFRMSSKVNKLIKEWVENYKKGKK
jgi:uncharacterized protein (DUF4415 family)